MDVKSLISDVIGCIDAGGSDSMSQLATPSRFPKKLIRPSRFSLLIHAGKTLKLIGALLKDRRVPFIRKMLFFGSILSVLVLLLFPDAFGEVFLSAVLPVIGTVLGVPIDAGFDWFV